LIYFLLLIQKARNLFGENIKRKPVKNYNGEYFIKEIIPTFQGEGPFTGYPAIFVRLGGCNLACKFCDTEFEDFKKISQEKLVEEIKEKAQNKRKLIVITGGEPLRQHIGPLCAELISLGFNVQIETNGLIYQELPSQVFIVCSPKANSRGVYSKTHPLLVSKIGAYKFLISKFHKGYDAVPDLSDKNISAQIYVQPMDEYDEQKNAINKKLTLEIAEKKGYNLCLQTHKIWGIY
jgi:7-carboxy-7-deazaguanine synthase